MSDTAILTYWDGRGNAEIIRLMMELSGQKYEEKVYGSDAKNVSTQEEMQVMRDEGVLAFDQLPLLQIDGLNLVQKLAAVRYIARKHNMYGSNIAEAAKCDIIAEGILDFKSTLKRNDSEAFQQSLKKFMPKFQRLLRSNCDGGAFFVGDGPTFVDAMLNEILLLGKELNADYSPWPLVNAYHDRFKSLPRMADYLSSDRRYPNPGNPGYYERVKASIPWVFSGEDAPPLSSEYWNFESNKM